MEIMGKTKFFTIFTTLLFITAMSFAESDTCNGNGNNGSDNNNGTEKSESDDGAISWQKDSVSATVTDVNEDDNEVTLKDDDGNTFTVTTDKDVNLTEISEGDKVNVEYYQSLATDFREPTSEDKENPLVITEETVEAPEGTEPAEGELRQIKAVVKIQDVDKEDQTVTVRGPQGNEYTLFVSDPSNLDKLEEGESITVTYTEALAVSIEEDEGETD